ncbi:MAG: tetratricopeptide repeat protein [Gemmatimonadota bacterium]
MRVLVVVAWLALCGGVGLAAAQEPVAPAAGLAAEAAGDWDAAIAIYERTASESGRADLWVRISRIQATRDRPQEALDAIERAVALEPSNVEFLRARAELAAWVGDYARAEDSHRRIGDLSGDPAAELGLARIAAWRGRTAASIGHYHEYLRMQPTDSVATLELARQETWRGNARAALDVLDGYRERFGETFDYGVERARALVTGGRPRAAIEILTPLLAERPDDYEARLVQTLALSDAGRRSDAVGSVDALALLDAANPRTAEVRAYVMAPIRSSVRPRFEYYDDSDDVRHDLYGVEAGLAMSPRVRLVAEVSVTDVSSEPGTGLAPLDGDETVRESAGDFGVLVNLAGGGELEGRLGGASVDDDGSEVLTWLSAIRLTPSDAVGITLTGQRDFLDVSARSLDLGIERTAGRAQLRYSPAIGWAIEAGGSRESYSDDNGRWEARVAVSDGVLRRQLVNVDLGVASRWLWFDENNDNGYYDPARYEQHLGVVSTYWKLDDQAGLSLRGAIGGFRDETIDSFERSIETAAEATFGITTDWSLVARAAWLDNVRSVTGAFNATGAGIYLTRRF